MKVFQIIPNLVLAGAETMCGSLAIELKRLNVDVQIVSLYRIETSMTERLNGQGIPIHYLDKKVGFDKNVIHRLHNLLLQEMPDCIHTHLRILPYVVPATVNTRIKGHVHTLHNTKREEQVLPLIGLSDFFYHVNHVIPVAISKAVQESVHKRYHIPLDRIPVIFNGIDVDRCQEKHFYGTSTGIKFIHVGRFSPQKNHTMLIKAFEIVHNTLPDAELILIGKGELEDQIRARVDELGMSKCVHFEGETSDVFSYLHCADVFVFPSQWEGFGLALAEAMTTGLPCVATNVGGIPDLIDDGVNGLLVDVKVESIAKGMLQMADIALREKLGKAAREKAVGLFSIEVMAKRYFELYQEMMSGR